MKDAEKEIEKPFTSIVIKRSEYHSSLVFMSPVSPVVHTEVTVIIRIKMTTDTIYGCMWIFSFS